MLALGAAVPWSAVGAHGAGSVEDVRQLLDEGRYREAELVARELLPEVESETGWASLETATVLDALAEALWQGGQCVFSTQCEEIAERALIIRENRLGEDPLVADSLVRKADALLESERYWAAEALLTRALSIYESAGPSSSGIQLARVNSRLGRVYGLLYQVEKEKIHAHLAVEILKNSAEPDDLVKWIRRRPSISCVVPWSSSSSASGTTIRWLPRAASFSERSSSTFIPMTRGSS
jgi:tetratricopeptide (TPR) repeat protein